MTVHTGHCCVLYVHCCAVAECTLQPLMDPLGADGRAGEAVEVTMQGIVSSDVRPHLAASARDSVRAHAGV